MASLILSFVAEEALSGDLMYTHSHMSAADRRATSKTASGKETARHLRNGNARWRLSVRCEPAKKLGINPEMFGIIGISSQRERGLYNIHARTHIRKREIDESGGTTPHIHTHIVVQQQQKEKNPPSQYDEGLQGRKRGGEKRLGISCMAQKKESVFGGEKEEERELE